MRKKEPWIKAIVSNFSLELTVKYFIAGYFLRDCADWLEIYRILGENPVSRLSIQSKEFIHLRFAMECALKSMVISLSKRHETAKQAYEAMRKWSHDLEKLVAECAIRAGGKYRILSPSFVEDLRLINKLGVGIRYDLDFKTAYKNQTISELYGDGPISGVVLSDEFRQRMHREVILLRKRALHILKRRLGKH